MNKQEIELIDELAFLNAELFLLQKEKCVNSRDALVRDSRVVKVTDRCIEIKKELLNA